MYYRIKKLINLNIVSVVQGTNKSRQRYQLTSKEKEAGNQIKLKSKESNLKESCSIKKVIVELKTKLNNYELYALSLKGEQEECNQLYKTHPLIKSQLKSVLKKNKHNLAKVNGKIRLLERQIKMISEKIKS